MKKNNIYQDPLSRTNVSEEEIRLDKELWEKKKYILSCIVDYNSEALQLNKIRYPANPYNTDNFLYVPQIKLHQE